MAEAHGNRGMPVPRLEWLRKRRALMQNELATASGVSRGTIINGEAGKSISLRAIRKLATALGVEPADLMGDEPPQE